MPQIPVGFGIVPRGSDNGAANSLGLVSEEVALQKLEGGAVRYSACFSHTSVVKEFSWDSGLMLGLTLCTPDREALHTR